MGITETGCASLYVCVCVFTRGSAGRNALMIALERRLHNRHLHRSWFWPSLCSLENLNQRAASRITCISHGTRGGRSVALACTSVPLSSPAGSVGFNAIYSGLKSIFLVLKLCLDVNAVGVYINRFVLNDLNEAHKREVGRSVLVLEGESQAVFSRRPALDPPLHVENTRWPYEGDEGFCDLSGSIYVYLELGNWWKSC